jgi:hypothetical protein
MNRNIKNQSGQLTLEFMLAVILIISVSTVLGILTFTLSMTEVLQYVTYAGARSYMAADMDKDTQKAAGEQKVHELLSSLPFLTGAEASGWITASKKTRGTMDTNSGYPQSLGVSLVHSQFEGYQLKMTVPILNIQIPFIGDVITPPNGAQDFGATLSSFLMREPAFVECQGYMTAAYQYLIQRGQYNIPPASQGGGNATPVVIMDNGC